MRTRSLRAWLLLRTCRLRLSVDCVKAVDSVESKPPNATDSFLRHVAICAAACCRIDVLDALIETFPGRPIPVAPYSNEVLDTVMRAHTLDTTSSYIVHRNINHYGTSHEIPPVMVALWLCDTVVSFEKLVQSTAECAVSTELLEWMCTPGAQASCSTMAWTLYPLGKGAANGLGPFAVPVQDQSCEACWLIFLRSFAPVWERHRSCCMALMRYAARKEFWGIVDLVGASSPPEATTEAKEERMWPTILNKAPESLLPKLLPWVSLQQTALQPSSWEGLHSRVATVRQVVPLVHQADVAFVAAHLLRRNAKIACNEYCAVHEAELASPQCASKLFKWRQHADERTSLSPF